MGTLKIAPDLEVPLELATQATAILGQRGGGKTNTAVVIVEEMIDAGIPVVVIDTVGVWWGLKSSADGQKAGLPVVVFGGDHADVPLEETAGKVIAGVCVDKRISCVIDTSSLPSKAAVRRFLYDFVTTMYHRNRQAIHLVFDEADELAPQRTTGEGAKLLGAMEDLVRRGRARGIGVTMVTQRPAVLNKDVLTQVGVLITMRMAGVTDVKAIDEWVKLHATDDEAREVKASLPSLPVGTAWLWSPGWLGILQRVPVRKRRTFDSSATPKIGEVRVEPRVLASVDLELLGAQIAATVEKQKADDPKELRRTIARLEKELAVRPTEQVEVEKTVEVPMLSEQDRVLMASLGERLGTVLALNEPRSERVLVARQSAPRTPSVAPPTVEARAARPDRPVDGEMALGKAHRAVLAVLATYGERTHVQVAILAGYSSKSGGFANTLSSLRSAGYVVGGRAAISITDAGLTALGDFDPLPGGQALIDHWYAQVGTQHRAILTALLAVYPNALTHNAVAEATGYSATSGGFANSLSKLRTLELIHGGRDGITVSETLGGAL